MEPSEMLQQLSSVNIRRQGTKKYGEVSFWKKNPDTMLNYFLKIENYDRILYVSQRLC